MHAEAPVEQLAIFIRVARAWNAAQQLETLALLDIVQHVAHRRAQLRQRKRIRREWNTRARAFHLRQRGIELGQRGGVKLINPRTVALDVGAYPSGGIGDVSVRSGRHRLRRTR